MMIRKIAILAAFCMALLIAVAPPSAAQDWFKTGTGLGVAKARVAAPDMPVRSPDAQPLEKTFHDVLWADLDYCGLLELVSPSFYPLKCLVSRAS